LVFIDETWTKTNMTRLRGWAPKGQRLVDKVPHGRWKTATFLAALRNDRIDAPCLFDGPINGERFRAYVEQLLVPTLKPGDVVILDTSAPIRQRPYDERSETSGRASCFCPGPQSDPAGLRQVQDFAAKGRSPNIRRCRRRKRSHLRSIPARRMRCLCEKRRIRVKPNADRSKGIHRSKQRVGADSAARFRREREIARWLSGPPSLFAM
jgi:hypothetical protein